MFSSIKLSISTIDFFDLEINYTSKKKKLVKNIVFRAVSLGLVAFAYIRKFVRTVYDSIIFNIVIKPLARIPINDSIFAYKVFE